MFLRPMQVLPIALFCLSSSLVSFAQGPAADTYKAKCQMCHGVDGLGATPAGKAMKARPFNAAEVLKESDAELIAIVKNGKAKMPAYTGKIPDGDIKELVAYIHTLQKK